MLWTALVGLLLGLVMWLGGGMLLWRAAWCLRFRRALLGFAAGGLLALALLEFIPFALRRAPGAAEVWILGTFLGLFLLDQLLHPHYREHGTPPWIWLLGIGWWVHSFFDGLAVAAGFQTHQTVGLLVLVGLGMHKFLDGLNACSLWLAAVGRPRGALSFLTLLSLATPTGALLGAVLPVFRGEQWFVARSAFLGGLFLYIATADLLPAFHEEATPRALGPFLLGCLLFLLIKFLLPPH